MEDSTPARILVVDDEADLRDILVSTLTRQGYETRGVGTGEEALRLLQAETFDILLSDLKMPGLDGLTLLQKSLELDPNLMVLIMTGQGSVQSAIEALKSGAFDYLLKPFKMQTLLPDLARALDVRRLRLDNLLLRESVALYELSQAIALTLDSQTIVEKTAEAALRQWQAEEVSVLLLLVTPAGDELQVAAVRGENRAELLGQRQPLDQGIAGWVARHHEAAVLSGAVQDPRFESLHPRPDLKASVSMPMLAGNQLIGVLNINARQRPGPFTDGQVRALSVLANTAASAIANAQRHAQLRQDEERFRALLENSSDAIALLNAEGQLVYDSPAAPGLLGYSSPELVGQNLFEHVHPADRAAAQAQFERLLQPGRSKQTLTLRFRHKTAGWRWLEVVASNLLAQPSVQAVVLNYHDVTERRQAEIALEEANQRAVADYRRLLERLDQLARRAGTAGDLIEIYRALREFAEVSAPCNGIFVSHYDPERQLRLAVYAGGDGEEDDVSALPPLPLNESPQSQAILTRQSLVVDDYQARVAHLNVVTLGQATDPRLPQSALIVPLLVQGRAIGAIEIQSVQPAAYRPEHVTALTMAANLTAVALENARLYSDLSQAYDETLLGWSRALDLRDKETEGHSLRVTDLTLRAARALGFDETVLLQVRRGALLHDIGKMGIPDSILLKPGPLTEDEWVIMRQHPVLAYELLSPIAYLRPALDIPYCHHEKWDGSGYPRGLWGEQIPLTARLFAVVDVWDALRSDRPYRLAWSKEKALAYIQAASGSHFDPQVVDVFLNLVG